MRIHPEHSDILYDVSDDVSDMGRNGEYYEDFVRHVQAEGDTVYTGIVNSKTSRRMFYAYMNEPGHVDAEEIDRRTIVGICQCEYHGRNSQANYKAQGIEWAFEEKITAEIRGMNLRKIARGRGVAKTLARNCFRWIRESYARKVPKSELPSGFVTVLVQNIAQLKGFRVYAGAAVGAGAVRLKSWFGFFPTQNDDVSQEERPDMNENRFVEVDLRKTDSETESVRELMDIYERIRKKALHVGADSLRSTADPDPNQVEEYLKYRTQYIVFSFDS